MGTCGCPAPESKPETPLEKAGCAALALLSSLLHKAAGGGQRDSSNSTTGSSGSTSGIQQYAVRLSFSIGRQLET
jgi:hypothetical protein